MRGNPVTVTGPGAEPVTTDEAKAHARIDYSDDDTLIDRLIKTARQHVERKLDRALLYQTFDYKLHCFPAVIVLPRPPLESVTSITYIDTNGTEQTLDSSKYRVVDNGEWPSIIEPEYSETWPSTRDVLAAVTVQFQAGYADGGASPVARDDIPEPIREAILLTVTHWYEHREASIPGVSIQELPIGAEDLLADYYTWSFP